MTAHEIRDEIGADRPVDARHTATPARPASSLGWAALAAGGLSAFALLTWIVASRLTLGFDQPLLDAGHGVSQYQALWQGLSDAANLPLIAIGIGLVLTLLVRREAREAGLVVLALAAVTAGSEAVKELVARPRPPGFGTSIPGVVYSYPSGHVLEVLTIFGMISILVWRSTLPWAARVAVPLLSVLAVVLVAVARVAVNAHYPSDVLAGVAGGLGCLGLFGWGTQAIARRRTAGPGAAA